MLMFHKAPFSLSNIYKDMSDVEYRRPIFNLWCSECHFLHYFDSDGEQMGGEVKLYHEETETASFGMSAFWMMKLAELAQFVWWDY